VTDAPSSGGKRRIDQILAPGFAEDLDPLDTPEVRRRRDLARAEREYLSLLRRLLQGRRDILRDELDRRRTGGGPQDVMERVVSVFSEGPRGPSRGEAPSMAVPDDEMQIARRRIEKLLADTGLSDMNGLEGEKLEQAVELLAEEERTISDSRAKVMAVLDTLQEEMKRRLKSELSNLPQ
jgi:RsiG-like